MTLLNALFFALAFRLLGNGGQIGSYQINRRYWILLAAFLALAVQVDDIWELIAYCAVFAVVRLRSTVPLLDASRWDLDASVRLEGLKQGFIRNLPIVLAVPFTSWLVLAFLLQPVWYYLVGKYRDRFYANTNSTMVSEILGGCLFGLCV